MYYPLTDGCDIRCIHAEKVQEARDNMLDEHLVQQLAELFKTMGDPTRLKMLHALRAQELCVCDLALAVHASESAVSHQLRLLRTQRLVKFRRDGKVLYYSLDDAHIEKLFSQGLDHVRE